MNACCHFRWLGRLRVCQTLQERVSEIAARPKSFIGLVSQANVQRIGCSYGQTHGFLQQLMPLGKRFKHRKRSLAVIRTIAGNHFVNRRSKRILIRCRRELTATPNFWRHVGHCAHRSTGLGDRRRGFFDVLDNPKIRKLRRSAGIEQNVLRFHVAMKDWFFLMVQKVQRRGNTSDPTEGFAIEDRFAAFVLRCFPVTQRAAGLKPHHVIGDVVDITDRNAADILNIQNVVTVTRQGSHRTGFLSKPLEDFGIVVFQWKLKHHDTVVGTGVAGFPHRSHPAFVQFLSDLVAAVDKLAGFKFDVHVGDSLGLGVSCHFLLKGKRTFKTVVGQPRASTVWCRYRFYVGGLVIHF